MTDNENIKDLEGAILNAKRCDSKVWSIEVYKLENALNSINQQKAEIKRLKKDKYKLQKALNQSEDYRVIAKSEAYKEFAERLKEKSFKTIRNYGLTKDVVEVCDIDNLLKEFERKEDTTYDD